jgi:hypothetical protein
MAGSSAVQGGGGGGFSVASVPILAQQFFHNTSIKYRIRVRIRIAVSVVVYWYV